MTERRIAGHCFACGAESLVAGAGGHVTCSRLACPNPAAVDELLAARGEHAVEWRVTGEPGPGYPTYDFTWSAFVNPHLGDSEAAARKLVQGVNRAQVVHGYPPWEDGPHVWKRSVARTPWTKIEEQP